MKITGGIFLYILYADESGNTGTDYDNEGQPVFSLTGIIVDISKWNEINDYINKKKKEIIPEYQNIELHTTDIFNGKKDKNNSYDFRKNGFEKNMEILDSLVEMAIELKPEILTFIVKKDNLKNYCKMKYDLKIKIDPYLIAFRYISKFFDDYLKEKNANGLIFLDEQEKIVESVDEIMSNLRLIDEEEIKVTNIVERAVFLNSFKSNFVQIADIFSFYINRYYSMENGKIPEEKKKRHIIKNYEKIKKFILKPTKSPYHYDGMLRFFDDNVEIFAEKK